MPRKKEPMCIGEVYRKSVFLIAADVLFVFLGIKSYFLHWGQKEIENVKPHHGASHLFLILCVYFKDNWQPCRRSTTSKKCSAWLLQIGDLGHWPANTIPNWNQRVTLAFPHWQEMETDGLSLVYVWWWGWWWCFVKREVKKSWHFLKKKGNSFVWVLFSCDSWSFR